MQEEIIWTSRTTRYPTVPSAAMAPSMPLLLPFPRCAVAATTKAAAAVAAATTATIIERVAVLVAARGGGTFRWQFSIERFVIRFGQSNYCPSAPAPATPAPAPAPAALHNNQFQPFQRGRRRRRGRGGIAGVAARHPDLLRGLPASRCCQKQPPNGQQQQQQHQWQWQQQQQQQQKPIGIIIDERSHGEHPGHTQQYRRIDQQCRCHVGHFGRRQGEGR